MHALSHTLQSITLGAPVVAHPLAMVPLLRAQSTPSTYLLLNEALDAGLAEVTEVTASGSVPELAFRNKANRDVLLLDGELLIGAKQHRVLNLSILVGAGQNVTIPVSCVEAGRWTWRSQRFSAGRSNLHASARAMKMRRISAALREEGRRARGDVQAAVWNTIDEKLARYRVASETRSLDDAFQSVESRLQSVRAEFSAQPQQVGVAFYVNGALAGLDLFDAPGTLATMLPKLVDSYAFDAFEAEATTARALSLDDVRALLARIAQAQAAEYPGVAKGSDVRIDDGWLTAAALVEGERVIHLSAFATTESA